MPQLSRRSRGATTQEDASAVASSTRAVVLSSWGADAVPRRADPRCDTGAVPAVQIVLSVLTLIAAGTSAFLVWRANTRATEQREQQARREEWWRRFQYATELALDLDNPHRSNVGVQLVRAMITSSLAGRDELLAADTVLDEVLALGDTGSNEAEDHDGDHHSTEGD